MSSWSLFGGAECNRQPVVDASLPRLVEEQGGTLKPGLPPYLSVARFGGGRELSARCRRNCLDLGGFLIRESREYLAVALSRVVVNCCVEELGGSRLRIRLVARIDEFVEHILHLEREQVSAEKRRDSWQMMDDGD